MDLKQHIRTVPNFPKPDINFYDITTLLANPSAFQYVIEQLKLAVKDSQIDAIVAIESRGFIFGAALAHTLGKSFVIVRKPGKLPYKKVSEEYNLEYGKDKIEIHKDAIQSGQKVLIIDDVLATGGTALAAVKLVERLGGVVVGLLFLIELDDLKGRTKLSKYDVRSVLNY